VETIKLGAFRPFLKTGFGKLTDLACFEGFWHDPLGFGFLMGKFNLSPWISPTSKAEWAAMEPSLSM